MTPSERRACILNTDGGARGNPGPAGSGFVLRDASGTRICEGGRYLGVTTNNRAEYDALIWGLESARASGCRSVEVRMDSELIVRQMTGRYRVKNAGLKEPFLKAQQLVRLFDAVRFVHVPRGENAEADALANEAMDTMSTCGDAPQGGSRDTQDTLF